MKRLTYLTFEDVLDIYQLALPRRHVPSRMAMDSLKHSTERGSSLDSLLTQGMHEIQLRLLRRIQKLSREALIELAALAWFGRGDAPFEQILVHARANYGLTLPYYLSDKEELATYLRHGMEELLGRTWPQKNELC